MPSFAPRLALVSAALLAAGLRAQAPWSFAPPREVAVPATDDAGWCRNDVDRFVFAGLAAAGLRPSPAADRRTLARRLHLVVLGLPPDPDELERFVADPREDAWERLVDRVLDSPQRAERWATRWLDLVRFAETTGFETNVPRPNAWPYRDWVIEAFAADTPYPDFILRQLAGDTCGHDVATGYLVAGPYDEVKSPDPVLTAMQRHDELKDLVHTTATAFLGLTLACAACHDHKTDPLTQRDFYAWKAIFAGVTHGEREVQPGDPEVRRRELERIEDELARIEDALDQHAPLAEFAPTARRPALDERRNVERFAPVLARFVRITVLATDGPEPCIDEFEVWSAGAAPRDVALASRGAVATASSELPGHAIHRIAHANDGRHGNEHSWISNEPGAGWLAVELAEPVQIDRVVWGRDRTGRFRDRLATRYRIEVALDPAGYRVVASELDRVARGAAPPPQAPEAEALARKAQELAAARARFAPRMVYAGRFTPPPPVHRLERGDPLAPREEIAPGTIAALVPGFRLREDASEAERRRALARWLGSAENPLTARVLVNRVWQAVFGEGLVATPSDFGRTGAPPTNQALLDHLALRFVAEGWSIRALERTLLLSSSFRQSSQPRDEAAALDSGNRLLWRHAPRRLEAEGIRDAMLMVSGALDPRRGGPGFSAFLANDNYVRVYEPKTSFTSADWRRMVYQTKVRSVQEPVFGVFDCPDAGQVAARRARSTTALQALSLFNSSFVVEQARRFAGRIEQEVGRDPAAQVRRAFLLAFGREPAAAEAAAAQRLASEHGLAALCRALLNASEFLVVP
ncbi:MAG: DUF1553 domain-containing protein [Planctomycetes bacterium]|nr:DUF1553 domain-containing protein [Planctomycetota bacterium]